MQKVNLFEMLFENVVSGAAIYQVVNDGLKRSDYIIKGFNKVGTLKVFYQMK